MGVCADCIYNQTYTDTPQSTPHPRPHQKKKHSAGPGNYRTGSKLLPGRGGRDGGRGGGGGGGMGACISMYVWMDVGGIIWGDVASIHKHVYSMMATNTTTPSLTRTTYRGPALRFGAAAGDDLP